MSGFDPEFLLDGVTLMGFHMEAGKRDFIGLAQLLARELEVPVEKLRPYLRGWYEGARYTLLDMGLDLPGCGTEEEIAEAMVTMEEWADAPVDLPPGMTSEPISVAPVAPTEAELRNLMAQALSAPTPEAILHFTGLATRMKGFGPFNVQMIFAQRPGAGRVASRLEWEQQGRTVRRGAIPIIILRPMGPIAYVYEELDTDPPVERTPWDHPFGVGGAIAPERLDRLIEALKKPTKRHLSVRVKRQDFGASLAGWITGADFQVVDEPPSITKVASASKAQKAAVWDVAINGQHTPTEQFVTLLHELGHLFCGHLGAFGDNNLEAHEYGWPDRSHLPHATVEIEAELVAWWLAEREGIVTGSPIYLKPFLEQAGTAVALVDLDRVTRAVARVRGYLGGRP